MRVVTLVVVVGLGAAGLGFWAGRATASAPAAVGVEPVAGPVASPGPSARRVAGSLVCASLAPGRREDESASCEALGLRARWCEGQLDQCTGQRKAVRQPWPEADTVEAPDAWADAVEEALAECEIGAELELVECTEYPCVAALRPADPALDEAGREQEMQRLMAAARACAPLRASLGLGGPEHDEAIDVYRLDARCGEGREAVFVLSALAPEGPAWTLLRKDPRSEHEERDLFRWLYRRADDVSGLWPCAK
jgi:hypothetical protein